MACDIVVGGVLLLVVGALSAAMTGRLWMKDPSAWQMDADEQEEYDRRSEWLK